MGCRGGLLVAILVVVASIASPGAGFADTWFPTAQMSVPRAKQTATLLPNGTVLVAGGYNGFVENVGGGSTPLDVVELFAPATGAWTLAAPMQIARSRQTATLLPNGQVLVVGGEERPGCCVGTRTAELYDPTTNSWTATPRPPELQEAATATLLHNGDVLVTGSFGPHEYQAVAGALLYDPSTNTWTSAAAPTLTRLSGTATLLPNGNVLVLGGIHYGEHWSSEFEDALSSSEIYDPTTNTWTAGASMQHPRWGQTATLMPGGEVLVAGGTPETGGASNEAHGLSSAELYDPTTNSWTAIAPMIVGRHNHTATLLPDGDVLVAGGWGDFGGAPSEFIVLCGVGGCQGAFSAELYEPSTNTWSLTAPVTTGADHTATVLPSGAVFVAGGNMEPVGYHELNTGYIYGSSYPPAESSLIRQPVGASAAATTPILRISDVNQSNRTWREGKAQAVLASKKKLPPIGTVFSFALNEQARVSFVFTQHIAGRKVKGKCVAQTQKNRRDAACRRTVTDGTLSFDGHSGANRVSFQGLFSRTKKLKPGGYKLVISATNSANQAVKSHGLDFTIVK